MVTVVDGTRLPLDRGARRSRRPRRSARRCARRTRGFLRDDGRAASGGAEARARVAAGEGLLAARFIPLHRSLARSVAITGGWSSPEPREEDLSPARALGVVVIALRCASAFFVSLADLSLLHEEADLPRVPVAVKRMARAGLPSMRGRSPGNIARDSSEVEVDGPSGRRVC